MITGRHHPRSRTELVDLIANVLGDAQVAVAQAGHFLLYQDEGEDRAVPCISSELTEERYADLSREHGQFPELSWHLGRSVLEALPLRERYLLVLVNDWQYVPSPAARDRFYREHRSLPESYIKPAGKAPVESVRFLTPRGTSAFSTPEPFFSERVLRNQFHRRLKKLISGGGLPSGAEVTLDTDGARCSLVDIMGEKREIYCSSKSADCASEVAQMIDECHQLVTCDTFINFSPAVCRQFVELGSELSPRIFGTRIGRVLNVSLPTTGVCSEEDLLAEAELTVHEF